MATGDLKFFSGTYKEARSRWLEAVNKASSSGLQSTIHSLPMFDLCVKGTIITFYIIVFSIDRLSIVCDLS